MQLKILLGNSRLALQGTVVREQLFHGGHN
jgi:hypothetical protein